MDSGTPAIILVSTHTEAGVADLIEQVPAAGAVAQPELSESAITATSGEVNTILARAWAGRPRGELHR